MYITWEKDSSTSKASALEQYSETIPHFEGVSRGSRSRDFIEIEPSISVKPGYSYSDYYAFRPDEQVPENQKRSMKMCMEAYNRVGIVKNIIDLMGDFGSQGINIVHENKSVEEFYQQWFKRVDGKERTERFLNNLDRTGNVVIYKSSASITPEIARYIKSMAADVKVDMPIYEKGTIPWKYNFLTLTVDMKDGKVNMFVGRKRYQLQVGQFIDNFKDGTIPLHIQDTLPDNIKKQIMSGSRQIELDPEKLSVFFYKKDDWQMWANPMVYSILDDIIMLQKMRLADMSALDGAISNIRLWTMGSFEYQIFPTKTAINKLRNILASNVGGGTMELVWGPELKYTESNSQVYKFLGSEKYQAVLNSIYAGLGVPPTLTGMAGNGGGFTNNFVSLKTLTERLQYGRDQVTKFWEGEAEIVRKAMGFRKSPYITFDQMSLSDESSEKALLIQLADREIISHETILERFNEISSVEKMRLKRESKDRQDDLLPDKISPFRKPADELELEVDLKKEQMKQKPAGPNGRPLKKKDSGPRKKRVDKPRSKPATAECFIQASKAFDFISAYINDATLAISNKTNLRQLTKSELSNMERVKVITYSNVDIFDLSNENILKAVNCTSVPSDFQEMLDRQNICFNKMPVDDYKRALVATYVEYYTQDL
jgi:hypothetical protein